MRIEIYSDTICPWCLIGKRRLERALKARPQPDLEIVWRAFQLNPNMPPEGLDRSRYLELKFGGAERARQVYEPVLAAGEAEGIAFDFDRMSRTPNTVASHRLVAHGQEAGRRRGSHRGGALPRPISARRGTSATSRCWPMSPPRSACRASRPRLAWPAPRGCWKSWRKTPGRVKSASRASRPSFSTASTCSPARTRRRSSSRCSRWPPGAREDDAGAAP